MVADKIEMAVLERRAHFCIAKNQLWVRAVRVGVKGDRVDVAPKALDDVDDIDKVLHPVPPLVARVGGCVVPGSDGTNGNLVLLVAMKAVNLLPALVVASGIHLWRDGLTLGPFLLVVHLVPDDPDAAPRTGCHPVAHSPGKAVIVLGQGDRPRPSVAVVQAGNRAIPVVGPTAIVESAVMAGVVTQFVGEHDPSPFMLPVHQVFAARIVYAKDVPGKLGFSHPDCLYLALTSRQGAAT